MSAGGCLNDDHHAELPQSIFEDIRSGVRLGQRRCRNFQGKRIRVDDGLAMGTLAGLTRGIGAMCFTPREISWDDETIRIRTKFSGFGDFSWRQLRSEDREVSWCGRAVIAFESRDGASRR